MVIEDKDFQKFLSQYENEEYSWSLFDYMFI